MSNINEVGLINIFDVDLFNFNRSIKLNISNFVQTIDIYESLDNQTIQADFFIVEGIDLISTFPIIAEEHIDLSFSSNDNKTISFSFFVQSIELNRTNTMGNKRSYVLRCVTNDFLKNSFTTFSKRYKDIGYDTAIKNVISNQLKSEKSVFVENTLGKFDYMVNRLRPLQVIDLISDLASSKENKSSLFYFYEDNSRYNFVTIDYLIKQRIETANERNFYYEPAMIAGDMEKKLAYRNILSYQITTQGNNVEKLKSGSMRNRINQFDISTGDYYHSIEYINSLYGGNFLIGGNDVDFNSEAFNNFAGSSLAYSKLLVMDTLRREEQPFNLEQEVFKRAYKIKINQFNVNMRIYGDTDIMVGDVINMNVKEFSGTDENPDQKLTSGPYFIYSLRHHLVKDENGDKFMYNMIFDLKKPNLTMVN
jgi:hypothetical protein